MPLKSGEEKHGIKMGAPDLENLNNDSKHILERIQDQV